MKTLVFVVVALLAAAAAGQVDGSKRREESQYRRQLEQNADGSMVMFKSMAKGADARHATQLQFMLHIGGDAPLRFRMRVHASNGTGIGLQAKNQLRVAFASLLEFTETNAGGFDGYNASVDPIAQQLRLNGSSWRSIGVAETETDPSSGAVRYRYRLYYPHPADPAKNMVQVNVTFGDDLFDVDGTEYDPEKVKIDVGVYEWQWKNASNYLALEARVQSRVQRRFRAGNTEGECTCTEGEYEASFAWVGTASHDGTSGNIVVASNEDDATPDTDPDAGEDTETANRWWFSFNAPGANKIEWDPTLQGSPASRAVAAFAAILLALTSLLF